MDILFGFLGWIRMDLNGFDKKSKHFGYPKWISKLKDRYLNRISDSDFLVGLTWISMDLNGKYTTIYMWDMYDGFLNEIILDFNG
jgi:hypothetical protein